MTALPSDKPEIDNLRQSAVDDSFSMMARMQVQVERITRNLQALEPDQPDHIKRLLNEWRLLLQRETKQFRERIEEGYQYARSFLAGPEDNVSDKPENSSQDGGE
jgi:hypothetical protein